MAYQDYDAILKQNYPDISAAEAHGLASGFLCVNTQADSMQWLNELGDSNNLNDSEKKQLISWFNSLKNLLDEGDVFEFDLSLPSEDSPLNERLVALRNWCQGFLFGFARVNSEQTVDRNTREILRDITELTKIDILTAGSDDDENDFAEIVEYLRAAVLILHDKLV